MNYRLSCYSSSKSRKNCYICELKGRTVFQSVFRWVDAGHKENMLEAVYRGLRSLRNVVQHEDTVYIEVQSKFLCDWLSGYQPYRSHIEYIDKVLVDLNGLDCKYMFVYREKPYAEQVCASTDVDRMPVKSFADFMNSLEE